MGSTAGPELFTSAHPCVSLPQCDRSPRVLRYVVSTLKVSPFLGGVLLVASPIETPLATAHAYSGPSCHLDPLVRKGILVQCQAMRYPADAKALARLARCLLPAGDMLHRHGMHIMTWGLADALQQDDLRLGRASFQDKHMSTDGVSARQRGHGMIVP